MNGKKINRIYMGVNGFLKWIQEIDDMWKAIHLLPALLTIFSLKHFD